MRREDYILRLVTEFVRTLHRMAGLADDGRHLAALEAADHAARQVTGAGLDDLLRVSVAELAARLAFGERPEVARDRQVFLAALLHQSGASLYALGEDEAADAHTLTALELQLDALVRYGAAGMPEYAPSVRRLVGAVGLYRLPIPLYAALVAHYEASGAYADAEDALHALLDAAPDDRAALELGIALYERLLARSDEELAAGDLSRAEVEEGLAELRARLA